MNNTILKKVIAGLFLLSGIASAVAATDQTTIIRNNLKSNLPDLVVDRILPTPVSGIYEIDSGRKVFYVDSIGKFAFVGNLLDLTSKASLTEARVNDLNRVDWKKIPTDIAIRRVIGKGQNHIAIFTDPDCPFCKRLEAETISKLDNVTIYYFLFPLPIHATAADDSKRILCAENQESALLSYMAKGQSLPKNNTCNKVSILTQMQEVGNNLVQVNGTPTIILPNGKITSGLIPADYLSRLIDQNQPESANISK